MSPSQEPFAVLLLGFGSPETPEEIETFLESLTGTRPSLHVVQAVGRKYESIGGRSPFREISWMQAAALQAELSRQGAAAKVFLGMRYSEPSIRVAVSQIVKEGFERIIALPLTPFTTDTGTAAYFAELARCIGPLEHKPQVLRIESWHDEPGYVKAVVSNIRLSLGCLSDCDPTKIVAIFTAHSVPSDSPGAVLYAEQLNRTISLAKSLLELPLHCSIAFQSKGGRPGQWLGPSLYEVLGRLVPPSRSVLLVPLGFIAEQVETLYDLDVEAASHARSKGISFIRAGCLNDSPELISALCGIVMRAPGGMGA